jgi:hypothetical protein
VGQSDDSEGRVVREIGLNERQKRIHKSPTQSNPYGLFDNQVIETANLRNDLTKEAFESLGITYGGHSSSKLKHKTVDGVHPTGTTKQVEI